MFSFRRSKEAAVFTDFFALLSVLPAFEIAPKVLETAYFREQRRFHPDRFIHASEEERLQALEQSANINKAYDTLSDPLKRAQYLLLLQGIFVGTEKDSVKPSHELLTEIMEMREEIEAAKTIQDFYKLVDALNAKNESVLNLISATYKKSAWDEMAQHVLKLGYVIKALEEVQRQIKPKTKI